MNTTTTEQTTLTIVDTFAIATAEKQRGASETKTFEYDLPQEKNGRTYRTTSSRVEWD